MVRSRTAWVRQLGLALSLIVLLASQLAAMGHLVFVQHSICEHGAAVHGGHAVEADRAPLARTGSDPAISGGERMERAHEHCDPSGIRPALVQADAYCLAPTLLDEYLLPWSLRPQRTEAPVSALELAPKNSPPV